MNQVIVLVEGPTEETFIKEVVRPYLQGYDVWVTPTNPTLSKALSKSSKRFQIQKKLMTVRQLHPQSVLKRSNLSTKKFFMAIWLLLKMGWVYCCSNARILRIGFNGL